MERPSVHTSPYPTDHSRRSDGASQRFTLCILRRNAAQTAQRDLVRCRKTREFLQLSSPPRLFCPLRRIIPERAMERPRVSHFSPSDGHPEEATERPAFHTSNPPTFPREPSGLKSLRLTPLSTADLASPGGSSRRGRRIPLLDRRTQPKLSAFLASVRSSEPSALRL